MFTRVWPESRNIEMLRKVPFVELLVMKFEHVTWSPVVVVTIIFHEVLLTPVTLDTSPNRVETRVTDTFLLRELKTVDEWRGRPPVRTDFVRSIVPYHVTNVLRERFEQTRHDVGGAACGRR